MTTRGATTRGHRCRHSTNGDYHFKLYTVYNNKTDFPVIVGATAKEAAEAMGVTYSSFQSLVTKCQQGIVRKWTILVDYADEEDIDE